MKLPVVAIIGRPNVGKSSLLNALAGDLISIVEPTAGVTRDRVSTIIEKNDMYFELIDTGGYGIVDSDQLSEHVEGQIYQALALADIVIFMVDIHDGVMALDKKIAQILRKEKLEVIGVANKADSAKLFPMAGEFSRLGFGDFLCISAVNNLNKSVLLDRILEQLKSHDLSKPDKPVMKIAIVGKRNTGKSTLVNAMAQADRVIASEIPGTTRDAIDVRIEKDGKTILLIDTAGVRKKSQMENSIEFYSYVRAKRSISRADVVLFLVDSMEPISQVDKKLARILTDEFKPTIIVINKWDLAKEKASTEDYEKYLTEILPGLKTAPIAFTTATEGKNTQSVLDLAMELFKQSTAQISTPKLNKAFETIKAERVGSSKKGIRALPKIYYATQLSVKPITILMFVNRPELFDENYMRFVTGRLKQLLNIPEIPIRLLARRHRQHGDGEKVKS